MLTNKIRLMILCSLVNKKFSVNELNQTLAHPICSFTTFSCIEKTQMVSGTYHLLLSEDDRVKQIIEQMYEFFCVTE